MFQYFDKKELYHLISNVVNTIVHDSECNIVSGEDSLLKLKSFIEQHEGLGKELLILELNRFIHTLPVKVKIFFLSFLLYLSPSVIYFNEILKIALSADELDADTKYFILYQCIVIGFTNSKMYDEKTSDLVANLYSDIYNSYLAEIKSVVSFIEKERRDKKLIIVMTAQFLGLNHGPTKTAVDRCLALQRLGYKVLLINTCELLSQKNAIPFYKLTQPNIERVLELYSSISFGDSTIPYYQASNMPNLTEVINILQTICEYKPYMIFNIGSFNLTADLCSNFVPVATIATVPSSLPMTKAQFHIIGREIVSDDIKYLEKYGFSEKNLIFSNFTFTFKPQMHHYTRRDLGLPEDKFLLALIGGRLTKEISNEFIELLLKTIDANTHLVFIGKLDSFEEFSINSAFFKENATNLGIQDDVLSILECCDLYVNPKRIGGGTSSVEALSKGVPVVTYRYGDVYTCSGSEFGVDDDEMVATIKKYVQDKEFYTSMSKKGIERAKILMDSETELKFLIQTIENNELFK